MDIHVLKKELITKIMDIDDFEFIKALHVMVKSKEQTNSDAKVAPQPSEEPFLKEPEEQVAEREIESWLKDL